MNVEHENISNLTHRKARIADLHQIIELLLEDELGGMRESKSAELDKNYIKAFQKIDSDLNQNLMVVENGDEIIGTCHLTVIALTHFYQQYPYANKSCTSLR